MKTTGSASPAEGGTRRPEAAAAPEGGPLTGPAVPWAVGIVMATIPCTDRKAEAVLAAAASRAGVTVAELAVAMVAERRGTALPAGVDRALSAAARAARRSPSRAGSAEPTLAPSTADAERVLGRFFDAQLRLQASPTDAAARHALEDSIFTLCVLMAEPDAHAAVLAAVQYTEG